MVSALVPGSNAPGSILFYSSICSLDLRTVPNNIILINMIVIVNNSNITKHNKVRYSTYLHSDNLRGRGQRE